KPTSEPASAKPGSGLPVRAPRVWQPLQSMILARYSPRSIRSCAGAGAAAERAVPSRLSPSAARAMIDTGIGLPSVLWQSPKWGGLLRQYFFRGLSGNCLYFPGGFPEGGNLRRAAERATMDDRKRIAAAIRDYLARERISREQFAFRT